MGIYSQKQEFGAFFREVDLTEVRSNKVQKLNKYFSKGNILLQGQIDSVEHTVTRVIFLTYSDSQGR